MSNYRSLESVINDIQNSWHRKKVEAVPREHPEKKREDVDEVGRPDDTRDGEVYVRQQEIQKKIIDEEDHEKLEKLAKKHGVSTSSLQKQLNMGMEVEKEHTSIEKEAKKIAMDHLEELPDYYTRLKKMENEETINELSPATLRRYKSANLKNQAKLKNEPEGSVSRERTIARKLRNRERGYEDAEDRQTGYKAGPNESALAPKNREIGTPELVKAYTQDTPGQQQKEGTGDAARFVQKKVNCPSCDGKDRDGCERCGGKGWVMGKNVKDATDKQNTGWRARMAWIKNIKENRGLGVELKPSARQVTKKRGKINDDPPPGKKNNKVVINPPMKADQPGDQKSMSESDMGAEGILNRRYKQANRNTVMKHGGPWKFKASNIKDPEEKRTFKWHKREITQHAKDKKAAWKKHVEVLTNKKKKAKIENPLRTAEGY